MHTTCLYVCLYEFVTLGEVYQLNFQMGICSLPSLALFWIKDFVEVWNFFFFFFGKTELVGNAILYVKVDVDCLN